MTSLSYDQVKAAASVLHDRTVAFRRHIHVHPERSFGERETSRYVAEQLTAAGIAFRPIAGTGLLAKIEGRGDLKQAVVLRADMDALPVREETGLPFASRREGVMHACGHDLHTACLFSALLLLNDFRDRFKGTVFGLFQPGEEMCPGGASLVLAEKPFDGYTVKAFIAQHVDPELPVGTLGLRAGKYMASGDEISITVRGRGGHAALPHLLADPVPAAAALITALREIPAANTDPSFPTVLAFGRVIADGATNVIPDKVRMAGTLRTFDEAWRARAQTLIRQTAEKTAATYGVTAEVDVAPGGFPCVVNDPTLTAEAHAIFASLWGEDYVRALPLRLTAEDFGYYTEKYPSLFYRLGVARTDNAPSGSLHTSTFNPDERALDQGVATLAALALQFST